MKKMIEYYYGFKNIELSNIGNKYYFYFNNKSYVFFMCKRSIEELNSLNKILQNNKIYNKIVPNIFNQLITFIEGKEYILVEKINRYDNEKISVNDILKNYNIIDENQYSSLSRTNWYELWTKKIDYILYQREHIRGKYNIIDEYLDYYIGLAEVAISYYKATVNTYNKKGSVVLSHRRIRNALKKEYYNVDDLIIDYPVRTLSEYLKYKFFNDNINMKDLSIIFLKINYDEYLNRLLFSRMLFPSYFFDIYERVVNDDYSQKELITIVKKIKKYEEFLKNIFYFINKKTRIPTIDWLS